MGVTSELAHLMLDTITVEPYDADNIDAEGNPAYSTPYALSARVVGGRKVIRDRDGREVVSMKRAYVDEGVETIGEQDRITLPDGSKPVILNVSRAPDSTGENATVVYFEG